MSDPNKLPEHNEAQKEADPKPPHKGSKWRKKAGTDEAYEPTPPPDKVPHLTDFTESKQDDDDEDRELLMNPDVVQSTGERNMPSNAPNLAAAKSESAPDESDKEVDDESD